MRVLMSWLEEMISVSDLEVDNLAAILTSLGLEVDRVYRPADQLEGLLAVRVSSVAAHPEADNLWVCQVSDGEANHQVICAAPNVREGMAAAWAPPGSLLPSGDAISEREFRGQVSRGMLLDPTEVGWGDVMMRREGIWELPETAGPGQPLSQALGLEEAVLELELTPNYAAHCQSVLGVARELSAYLDRPLNPPSPAPDGGDGQAPEISIQEPDLCPRYMGQVLSDVRVVPSPWWLQKRLILAGMRPHNSVVDVTNYVMLETGQPLHAFDFPRLAGSSIVVRRARQGESLTTLDGTRRDLSVDDLIIADRSRPVALAGVMGGQDTEVGPDTAEILLESASFDATAIRRTATRLGLRTDASARFEKDLDLLGTDLAIRRAAGLLAEVFGARAASPVADVFPSPPRSRSAGFRPERARRLLGLDLSSDAMRGILTRLGCRVEGQPPQFSVKIPSWRTDIAQEIDLVEEVARHHGYDQIPERVPRGEVARPHLTRERALRKVFRRHLLGAGLDEVVTYSFASDQDLDDLRVPDDHPWRKMVPIRNPLGAWQQAMRTLLLPGLLKAAAHNQAREVGDVSLFELGRVYVPAREPSSLPEESWRLAVVLAGRASEPHWSQKERAADFFDLKGILDSLLTRLGPEGSTFEPWQTPWLHPGRAARVRAGGRDLGWLGELHPQSIENLSLEGRVLVAEMDLDAWWSLVSYPRTFTQWSRYPAVTRDLAFTVREETPVRDVERCIREAGGALLEEFTLFDVYRGEQVEEGRKSLAYSLTYRSGQRTLTDQEVEQVHQAIRQALAERVDARLRS